MTIIEPNKNKIRLNPFLIAAVFCLIAIALLNIYIYNQNVNLKDLLNADNKKLEELEVANAEFKNNFYQTVDSRNLNALAKQLGLREERQPRYFDGESTDPLAYQ
ncbi:MAG: hypothetical protein A2745_03610 [Candidatus Harrisonbacteria bacterium RIFCSPHIGHO2_01_FULL_44_13]|uniref:Cell division protein FtsL n=1 Tax=Candidatus Harrisonbacteria bacterium RIFCSPLOWO2_01_FULL_44_18 TaxID=1798407 RepID=A0A1G1ZL63_9BACT|nr:MAG: hypothetical protein A2745_03610 [Candidatus Harrisonbacteria bacterium RIFCSPHIGHO2_01_FULL_44_13]OGY65271.1 MAG: hypothetical protein A3A16_01975 [Candidatus Harrisonbacteria bacterium RIFCSPLOWO2_01_FULL_44_18]